MTPVQARALSALMINVHPHDHLPDATDIVDGCFVGASEGRTPGSIAASMDMWQLIKRTSAASAGKVLNALVRAGFAARVFLPGEQSPRYVATAAGAADHRRRYASLQLPPT